ncbi:hypothetical protein [Paenibacillus tarimensis]|uniref:hypothetical protein n=1 Tax=Paenibacillus tarimensis TaxID=416012 RepID=UPI001F3E47FF|nr:hypothetical protein [Paenibacillus tarimensis]MCF2946352.1 hypothetical protein [Paenibacillus tarimensis]
MKRTRFLLLCGLAVIVTIISVVLVQVYSARYSHKLDSVKIHEAFEQQGIPLTRSSGITDHVFTMTLRDVAPEVFTINNGQSISVYLYDSSNEVPEAIADFEAKTATADVTDHERYEIGNALIFYNAEGPQQDIRVQLAMERLAAILD